MGLLRALYFAALAGGGHYLLKTQVLNQEGFKAAGPVIKSSLCFEQDNAVYYPFVSAQLNQLNCMLNSLFIGARSSKEASALMGIFGTLFLSSILISVYESFRPVHARSNILVGTLARAASLFLLIGQVVTAGVSTPAWMFFVNVSRASGIANTRARLNTPAQILRARLPAPAHAWTALIAVAVGYLGPSAYLGKEKFSFEALSIWQIFPVYIFALSLILPRILGGMPFFKANVSRSIAVCLIALLGTYASAKVHFLVLRSSVLAPEGTGLDLRDVFLLRPQSPAYMATPTYAMHRLFLVDFSLVTLATLSNVIFSNIGAGISTALLNVVFFVVVSAGLGPGAAVILLWAYIELSLGAAQGVIENMKQE